MDVVPLASPRHERPLNVIAKLEQHWVLERRLGSGSQGQVWSARSRNLPERVAAVKLLRNGSDAMREIAAYEQLRGFPSHPNVLAVCFGLSDG